MTGARLVHDTLEQEGWDVEIADAQKVKGLAPLACKTDKIDSQVLAVLSQRDLVPAIWLPDPRVREERELARFRLHLVKHKSALKNRVHSTLINFGKPCPVTDLFGVEGRRAACTTPGPGALARQHHRERGADRRPRRPDRGDQPPACSEGHADHPYIPLLMSAPGIGWVLAFTIAAEIGEIERFPSPEKLAGYTGLCPRVNQSGDKDRRGPLTKHGPTYLRWALLEATMHALKHPAYARALPAQQAPARQAARRQGRPGRHRPPARPRDLAHAFPQPAVRSQRRRFSSGGLTALFGHAPASEASNFA